MSARPMPQQPQLIKNPRERRIRNIREQSSTSSRLALEQEQESIDHESTYYIHKTIERWNQVNQILPEEFENKNPTSLNPSFIDENWIKTTSESMELNWIAEIGSPKSLINEETALLILRIFKKAKQFRYNQNT